MFNNFFRKKDDLTETYKQMLKNICLFYEANKQLFVNSIESQKDKKEIIKKIYKILDYSNFPILSNNQNLFNNSNIKLYRGISAENNEVLKQYVNDFINGDVFYGGRASIYGTGIYNIIGNNIDVANKYATDGQTNECGIILESILNNNSKIIESSKIGEFRNILLDKLKKLYSDNINNYLEILDDDGALAAILGYDAIYVPNKEYMVVLNRSKMLVNSNNIKIAFEKGKKDNYSKK